MSKLAKTLQAAAGNAGGDNLYVEDVFSTYLYTGNDSVEPTIVNGIDLENEGGLVWIKSRDDTPDHYVFDTERGLPYLIVNSTAAQQSAPLDYFISYNSDGFTGANKYNINKNNGTFASWSLRKSPKFFDVVTYTGDGSSNLQVNHNLGAAPGMLIVKRTDSTSQWWIWHRSLNGGTNQYSKKIAFTIYGEEAASGYWADQNPTDTSFFLGGQNEVNEDGGTYVAYLFAHDAGGFGDDGEQNIISCGSYTGNGSSSITNFVNLGWEPQWVLVKNAGISPTENENWYLVDNMRGSSPTEEKVSAYLRPNESSAEVPPSGVGISVASQGFYAVGNDGSFNRSGQTYIYIAIRRGPMKTPEAGTEVFAVQAPSNTNVYTSGFPVDLLIQGRTDGSGDNAYVATRLMGKGLRLLTSSSGAEDFKNWLMDSNTKITDTTSDTNNQYRMPWMFRRAPGFFDVVAYTGTGVARAVPHNLGVAPEMMIVKPRDSTGGEWKVYSNALSIQSYLRLNLDEAFVNFGAPGPWNNTAPTDSAFNVSVSGWSINDTGRTYIAYLFASCPGVSKVGSYTGTGADLNVDCGFSAGARFILIKRTDSTGDWYVWDSARGISAGNDPYLLLNSAAAENTSTDYIDPLASGFTVTSNASSTVNVDTGTYIFLAIA
jgi:hypothetical protein